MSKAPKKKPGAKRGTQHLINNRTKLICTWEQKKLSNEAKLERLREVEKTIDKQNEKEYLIKCSTACLKAEREYEECVKKLKELERGLTGLRQKKKEESKMTCASSTSTVAHAARDAVITARTNWQTESFERKETRVESVTETEVEPDGRRHELTRSVEHTMSATQARTTELSVSLKTYTERMFAHDISHHLSKGGIEAYIKRSKVLAKALDLNAHSNRKILSHLSEPIGEALKMFEEETLKLLVDRAAKVQLAPGVTTRETMANASSYLLSAAAFFDQHGLPEMRDLYVDARNLWSMFEAEMDSLYASGEGGEARDIDMEVAAHLASDKRGDEKYRCLAFYSPERVVDLISRNSNENMKRLRRSLLNTILSLENECDARSIAGLMAVYLSVQTELRLLLPNGYLSGYEDMFLEVVNEHNHVNPLHRMMYDRVVGVHGFDIQHRKMYSNRGGLVEREIEPDTTIVQGCLSLGGSIKEIHLPIPLLHTLLADWDRCAEAKLRAFQSSYTDAKIDGLLNPDSLCPGGFAVDGVFVPEQLLGEREFKNFKDMKEAQEKEKKQQQIRAQEVIVARLRESSHKGVVPPDANAKKDEEDNNDDGDSDNDEDVPPKWDPAKFGDVSKIFGLDVAADPEEESFDRYFMSPTIDHDTINQLSDDQLHSFCDTLKSDIDHARALSSDEKLAKLKAFFNISDASVHFLSSDACSAEHVAAMHLRGIACLYRLMERRGLVANTSEATQNARAKICSIACSVKIGADNVALHFKEKVVSTMDTLAFLDKDDTKLFKCMPDFSEKKPFTRVLYFLKHEMERKAYRRRKKDLFRQIQILVIKCEDKIRYIPLDEFSSWPAPQQENHSVIRAVHSHAWEKDCTIKEFVARCVQEDSVPDIWEDLHSSSGLRQRVIDHLEASPEIVDLKPNRLVWAFCNGIIAFDSENGDPRFYPFGPSDLQQPALPLNLVCCKYYNQEFDSGCLRYDQKQFMEIPTPSMTKILNYQNLDTATQEVFFALLGRLLYRANDLENWGVSLFIKGVEESGKSAVGKLVQHFFKQENIAVISEDREGYEQVDLDKSLFVCMSMTKYWEIPAAAFKSATPGLFIGSQVGHSELSAAALSKRLLVCEFSERFASLDPDLDDKLEAELPALIVKCQQAYMSMINKCAGRCIWTCVPHYFKRMQLKFETNQIKRFLAEPQQFTVGEALKMPLIKFGTMFRAFLQTNSICYKWNRDLLERTLKQANFKLVQDYHSTPTKSTNGPFIAGLAEEWPQLQQQLKLQPPEPQAEQDQQPPQHTAAKKRKRGRCMMQEEKKSSTKTRKTNNEP
jgi:hypothetical protein